MIRINQIKLPVCHTTAQLDQKIARILKRSDRDEFTYEIAKRSIDARKKPEVYYVYTVDVTIKRESELKQKIKDKNVSFVSPKQYLLPQSAGIFTKKPVIVGTGPCGLFCAYTLLAAGIPSILLERGRPVEERSLDVERFWQGGALAPSSNVQFGEGGAGTFSDGKLNTLVKDACGRSRFVLETFVKFGAPEHIRFEAKPHIGTDILMTIMQNMRWYMSARGVEYRFHSCMTDYRSVGGKLAGVEINHSEWLDTDCMVLAIGHSARDTFRMLRDKQELAMAAKSFAVGFRVEHPQREISIGQYGERYWGELPPAAYKLTANFPDGRGVYSFCMCPGGYVVNASSEPGYLAVNGMSYSARDGANANSAIIVTVTPEDFDAADGALGGVAFQERLEQAAFALGGGKIPQQLFGDYCANLPSVRYGSFESCHKGAALLCNLRGLLPEQLEETFIRGMKEFSHHMSNYDRNDAILSAIETRTSSPVRIGRGERFMAKVRGIYPGGEGAGYAGGIMSAAMDGMKIAEAIVANGVEENYIRS